MSSPVLGLLRRGFIAPHLLMMRARRKRRNAHHNADTRQKGQNRRSVLRKGGKS
jgi:hypothetical protein